jgi:SAM-dependent methyltransferase
MRAFYENSLALIHNAGFGALARGAGRMVLEHLRARTGEAGTVVDLGCGSGILAEQISTAGFSVVGVDVSPHLLSLARARAPRAEFVLSSIYDAELPRAAAVTMIGEVSNYVLDGRPEDADFRRLIGRIGEALEPGGLLLFDAAGPGRATDTAQQSFTHRPEWSVTVEAREDAASARLTREITTFRRVGDLYRREDETHVLRLWPPDLVEDVLAEAGFRTERLDRYHDVLLPKGLIGYRCVKAG